MVSPAATPFGNDAGSVCAANVDVKSVIARQDATTTFSFSEVFKGSQHFFSTGIGTMKTERRSADFQVCCIAGFQTDWMWAGSADVEIGAARNGFGSGRLRFMR
ncbi:MAG: hypothetical protein L0Z50_28335 [Verrucomicrobiales bacterium]|nr:hypothetical protein [Verrucomicrobiales bacterium]